ncbi:hypothetical protein ACFLZV_05280, partial [Candidatus Margulisiibacteriota bacterium]
QKKYFKEFRKKLDDFGLLPFTGGQRKGPLDTDTDSSKNKKQDQNPYAEELSAEQAEDIEERLRLLYMQRALTGGLALDIRIKIRRITVRMKKSGQYSSKQLKKLRKEGEAVAIIKFTEMVWLGFEERAALPYLEGPGYSLIKKKIKYPLKGLKALKAPLTKEKLKEIRDTINQTMFDTVKEEYLLTAVQAEQDPKNILLLHKVKTLLAHLGWLMKESNIKDDLKPRMFADMWGASDKRVIEAA